jgi:uncharacterized protein YegP (UPF0339 family)
MYFTIRKSGGQWRWRLKAANHEIIATGESYHNKADCLHVISLIKGTSNVPVYEE